MELGAHSKDRRRPLKYVYIFVSSSLLFAPGFQRAYLKEWSTSWFSVQSAFAQKTGYPEALVAILTAVKNCFVEVHLSQRAWRNEDHSTF